MTHEEIRLQVAVSALQGVLEAKLGVVGEALPSVAVEESLRIADEFVKQWFKEDGKKEETVKKAEREIRDWSEEDETMLNNIIWRIHMRGLGPLDEMDDREIYVKYENFLQSLRSRIGVKAITKDVAKEVVEVLREKFGLDSLDIVEFTMELERRLKVKIPDDWLATSGHAHTVKVVDG